jgi:hypothetical protein
VTQLDWAFAGLALFFAALTFAVALCRATGDDEWEPFPANPADEAAAYLAERDAFAAWLERHGMSVVDPE